MSARLVQSMTAVLDRVGQPCFIDGKDGLVPGTIGDVRLTYNNLQIYVTRDVLNHFGYFYRPMAQGAWFADYRVVMANARGLQYASDPTDPSTIKGE